MRVTNRMTSRNYLKGLNKSLNNVSQTQNRLGSGMKISEMSENVSIGSRAMRLNQQLTGVDQHLANISSVTGELDSADSILQDVHGMLSDLRTKIIAAKGDANKRDVVAHEIEGLKNQIIQFCNFKFGENYIFGGTNNTTAPFTVEDGKALFNGVPVDDIYKRDGKFYYMDEGNETQIPQSEDVYIDVGVGLKMSGSSVDPATAFKISFSGLDVLGFGTTTAGGTDVSNNVFNILSQAQEALNAGDVTALNDISDHMSKVGDNILINETDVGNRASFLDKVQNRLTDQKNTLEKMSSTLLSINEGEEAMNLSSYQATLKATLQLGSQILPLSLMDFIS